MSEEVKKGGPADWDASTYGRVSTPQQEWAGPVMERLGLKGDETVLDAGCGPGRVAGTLSRAGHAVVGVDIDPVLITAAEHDHPGPTWLVADLAELDLPAMGIAEGFDLVVCAGNVLTFLDPATRRPVLARLAAHLRTGGRIVTGFGSGRDYSFAEFFDDVEHVGLVPDVLLSAWDLRPFTPDSNFLVAVLSLAAVGPATSQI